MSAQQSHPTVREGYLPVGSARLFYREVGRGQPIVVLHGGPDFDHTYLLPDMDRLADSYRLIYYDQRGRGKSDGDVQPRDISIQTEMDDLEAVRQHFQLEKIAIMGHSWGGILALEYALRHPERVSHLILLNTAPVSYDDWNFMRQDINKKLAADETTLHALKTSAQFAAGDPDTVTAYYRIRFAITIKQPQHLDTLMHQMRQSFTNDGVLRARAIEAKLVGETGSASAFNLLAKLAQLRIPTLVIHSEYDHVPVEVAEHVAQAIPDSRYILLRDSGHFSYMDAPDAVRKALDDFLAP